MVEGMRRNRLAGNVHDDVHAGHSILVSSLSTAPETVGVLGVMGHPICVSSLSPSHDTCGTLLHVYDDGAHEKADCTAARTPNAAQYLHR